MASNLILRFFIQPLKRSLSSSSMAAFQSQLDRADSVQKKKRKKNTNNNSNSNNKRAKVQQINNNKKWRCLDSCCWVIGCMFTMWWVVLFSYYALSSTILPGLVFNQAAEPPGERLRREGVAAVHPVVLVPGIITGGLEMWEGRPCAADLFRKRLWGGGSFAELVFKRPLCLLEHLHLDNETGLDPPGIRVRAVPGLVAADYFARGYFVWAVLIENLAKIGYEDKNLHMAAYDWRLSFHNTEIRDGALNTLKSKIELMYITNGYKKVVVVPHSMGVIYFLYFMKWVESPPPMGGGGGSRWCDKHIKAIMNIGPTFLGVPKSISNILSAEIKDIVTLRAMAPGFFDSKNFRLRETFEHLSRLFRSWDSIIALLPKGGETIWGDMDWSPDDEHQCDSVKEVGPSITTRDSSFNNNSDDGKKGVQVKEPVKYGRILSFSKEASQLPSSKLSTLDLEELATNVNLSRGEVSAQNDEMSGERIRKVPKNKTYTASTIDDLLRIVAPELMQRAESHFSRGIAENLDDPKYDHYKYWSNPLETKLPHAPEMEIYCLYGVGILTERSYIYTASSSSSGEHKTIPFRVDISVNRDSNNTCLQNGIYLVDGDQSVPVLSSGFMCAKPWRGKTQFNPSGINSYVREYKHKAPENLLEGRGLKSGSHVDIMGNVALIEDVLKVASGDRGGEIGGDRIHSNIIRIAERINLKL